VLRKSRRNRGIHIASKRLTFLKYNVATEEIVFVFLKSEKKIRLIKPITKTSEDILLRTIQIFVVNIGNYRSR